MSDNHSQVPNYYGTQEGAQQVYGSTNAEYGSGEQGAPQLYEVVRDNADFGSQGHGIDSATHSSQNAYNSRRPLNTQPVPEGKLEIILEYTVRSLTSVVSAGGVTREGRQNLPEGQASYGDKLIGKVEKVSNIS